MEVMHRRHGGKLQETLLNQRHIDLGRCAFEEDMDRLL